MTIWRFAVLAFAPVVFAGCVQTIAEHPAADEEAEEPAVVVRVAAAEIRTLEQTVKAFGLCEALVDKHAMLTPAIEGHVHAILAVPGAEVKAGQPIIELDPRLPAADLAEKEAMREGAKATLDLLKSLPRSEEQLISKLAINQGGVAQDRAQSLHDSLKPLAERNEVSRQQLFDAAKAVEQARLQKESAEAQFQLSMLGPRAEAIEEGTSRIRIAEQAAQSSRARLDLHTIRAPIDGVLQDVTCRLGQTIAAGTPVGEVVDAGQLYVLAWLPPRAAQGVHVGQHAKVFAGTLVEAEGSPHESTEPAEEGEEPKAVDGAAEHEIAHEQPSLAGEVVFVGQVADPQTGNLPTRCLVDNAERGLAIGQTVSLSIAVRAEQEVLSVPVAAIFDLGEGPLLNVVRDGKSVQLHPKLGLAHEGWVGVSDTDLEPGEAVIVDGGYNLKEETPVKIEGSDDATEKADATEKEDAEEPEKEEMHDHET